MNIGESFELTVEKLYRKMGYEVERRKVVRGVSGAYHEIDLYAYKKSLIIKQVAIECKWRKNLEIGKKEIANFLIVLDDTKIKEGHIVTNSFYSKQAKILAKKYNLKLIDGSMLKKLLKNYSVNFEHETQNFNFLRIIEKIIFPTLEFLTYIISEQN
ncbi:MAG: restriction endonuclease [Candidatus Aenigmatarchaeota archaeon]